MTYERGLRAIIVIGASAGGVHAVSLLLSRLPKDFPVPIAVVQHTHRNAAGYSVQYINERTELSVKEGDDKEKIRKGSVYISPPNYHLLIEGDGTLSLSADERVNYARPSIDVLFESAADSYGSAAAGILLTGANEDGVAGLEMIKKAGGIALVQDPDTAEARTMPEGAVKRKLHDFIGTPEELGDKIAEIFRGGKN
jgi:two-component system, chemotaxis family, protein-glutamate methylesterase/glutaminase